MWKKHWQTWKKPRRLLPLRVFYEVFSAAYSRAHLADHLLKYQGMKAKQKCMNASEFKASCLRILDELDPSGLVILKRGKPVAKLIPLSDRSPKQLIGS